MQAKVTISKSIMILCLFTMTMWMPVYFKGTVIKLLQNGMFIMAGILLIRRRYKPSMPLLLMVIYFTYLIVISLYNRTQTVDIHTLISYSKIVVWSMLMEYCMHFKFEKSLKMLWSLVVILIVSSSISVLICPDGLYTIEIVWNEWSSSYREQWLLGNKNSHGMWFVLASIVTYGYFLSKRNFEVKKRLTISKLLIIVGVFLALVTLIMVKSSTGLVAVTIAWFALYSCICRDCKIVINTKLVVIIYAVVAALVILGGMQFLQPIIQLVFKKDITFTGRNIIWANSLLYISQKPVLGWGVLSTSQITSMLGSVASTSAHNQFLNTLLQGGLLLFAILLLLLTTIIKKIDAVQNNNDRTFLIMALLSVLVVMMFESCLNENPAWAALLMIYLLAENSSISLNELDYEDDQ